MFRLDLALGLRQKSSDDDWGRNGQSGGSPLLLLAETNGESEKNPPFPRKLEAELRFRLLSGSVLASLSPNMNHSPGQPSCKTLRVGNKWPDATEPDKSLGGHPLRRPLLRKQGRALGSPHHGVPWAGQSASGGVVTCVTHGRGGAEAEPDAGTGGGARQGACVLCRPAGLPEVFRWLRQRWRVMAAANSSPDVSLREATQRKLRRFSDLRGTKGETPAPLAIGRVLYVLDCHFLSARHL